jgi:hypothetical protein
MALLYSGDALYFLLIDLRGFVFIGKRMLPPDEVRGLWLLEVSCLIQNHLSLVSSAANKLDSS